MIIANKIILIVVPFHHSLQSAPHSLRARPNNLREVSNCFPDLSKSQTWQSKILVLIEPGNNSCFSIKFIGSTIKAAPKNIFSNVSREFRDHTIEVVGKNSFFSKGLGQFAQIFIPNQFCYVESRGEFGGCEGSRGDLVSKLVMVIENGFFLLEGELGKGVGEEKEKEKEEEGKHGGMGGSNSFSLLFCLFY